MYVLLTVCTELIEIFIGFGNTLRNKTFSVHCVDKTIYTYIHIYIPDCKINFFPFEVDVHSMCDLMRLVRLSVVNIQVS